MGSVGNIQLIRPVQTTPPVVQNTQSMTRARERSNATIAEEERRRNEANAKYRNMRMVELLKLRNDTYTRLELDTTMSDEEKRKLRNEYQEMQHVLANKLYKR